MEEENQEAVLVDAIIAVHSLDRPVDRAVASLVDGGLPTAHGTAERLRINVVCHNIDVNSIRKRVAPEHRELVRFLHCTDGIKSPAGPFNMGISFATGTWVSIMGSDDSVEPGAMLAWVNAAGAGHDSADVLVAPMAHANGGSIRTPVVRRTQTTHLDPLADRLSYRTAPLGLMRLSLVQELNLNFPTRYATGEDQSFSAQLWFSGARISYGRGLPRYLVHDDAKERVTATDRIVTEDMKFATDLVQSDWFRGLTEMQKAAIVTKIIRVHVFGHTALRAAAGKWAHDQAAEMAEVVRILLFSAPKSARPLSVADRALLDAIARGEDNGTTMNKLSVRRRSFSHPRTWIPRDLTQILHPEAPLRFMSASALVS